MVETLLEQATWLTPTTLFLLLNAVIATILVSSAFTTSHSKPSPHHDNGSEPTTAPPPPLARAPSLFSRVTSFNFSNYHPDNNHQQLRYNYSSPSLYTRVTSFKLSGRTSDEPGQNEEVTQDWDKACDTSEQVSHGKRVPPNNDRDSHLNNYSSPSLFTKVTSFKLSGRANNKPGQNEEATQKGDNTRVPLNNKGDSHVDKVCKVNIQKRVARAPSFLSRVASFPLGMRNLHVDEDNKKKGKKKAEGDNTTSDRKKEEEVDAKADDFINRFKQQLKLQRIESFMRNRSASSVN